MRIKKTSQYIEGGASLSNTYGESNTNGYTQEYINALLTDSREEHIIGKDYDGNVKYARTFVGDLNTTGVTLIQLDSNCIIRKWDGFLFVLDVNKRLFIPLNYPNLDKNANVLSYFDLSDRTININYGSAWRSTSNLYAVNVEYIKL